MSRTIIREYKSPLADVKYELVKAGVARPVVIASYRILTNREYEKLIFVVKVKKLIQPILKKRSEKREYKKYPY